MTAPSTTELLLAWDQTRPRTKQTEFGMSELGGCRKRAGYRLAGVTPTNPSSSMQAVLGSAIHEPVAAILEQLGEPGDLFEHEVHFAGIKGHLDRYHAATKTVIDVKTTSSRWLEHIKLHGPDLPHLWQVHAYGAGLFKQGHEVARVRIDYIARDTGEEWHWPSLDGAPFNPSHVRDAIQWVKTVRDTPLGMLPRDHTPDSAFCSTCPFRDPCWDGYVPERNRLSVLFVENPDAEAWAAELWEARQAEKTAKARAKKAAGALDAIRPDEPGRVQCGSYTLDFRSNGLYFVSGSSPQPAVGFQDGDAA